MINRRKVFLTFTLIYCKFEKIEECFGQVTRY